MSRFGTHYQVARPTGVCAASGVPLEPGAECVATLCETVEDGFERRDFSPAAWAGGGRPEGLFSYWRTVVPEARRKERMLVDDAVLLDLFERLADDERDQRVAFRFVLGLILLRKRKLKFVGRVERDGQEVWKMLPRPSDPDATPLEVVNPRLSEDDVRELTGQLSEILQSEL